VISSRWIVESTFRPYVAGEILVSRTIRDLVAGSPIRLERHGTHELKGVPGPWEIFAVTG
jgi:class 3 adenylate cyclase